MGGRNSIDMLILCRIFASKVVGDHFDRINHDAEMFSIAVKMNIGASPVLKTVVRFIIARFTHLFGDRHRLGSCAPGFLAGDGSSGSRGG